MTLEEIKGLLEKFKTDIQATIDTKIKDESDTSNKDVADLKEKLTEVEKGLSEIREASKKTFGLPGVENEKERWNWGKYYIGLIKNHLAGKGELDHASAKNYWDTTASFEAAVCKDYTEKVYTANDGSSGGFLVPPEIYKGDVIDTVYANTAMLKLPLLKFENLKGDLPIPVDESNLSPESLAENEAPSQSTTSFGLKWLRPKKIGVFVRISNRLLDQTSNAIEMIVKNKMALDASVELSRCLTNGTGTDSEGKGLLTFYSQFTGTSNLGTNGRRFTIDDLADMKMSLAAADELRDTNTYGSIMRPEILFGMLRERVEMYSGQAARKGQPSIGTLLIDQSAIENAAKLSIQNTTQIPKSTVGSSATNSKVVTGDFSKFVYATFRDPIFRVSDQATDSSGNSAFLKDEIFLVMFLEYDCTCLRPSSFTGRDGAETNKSNW